MKQCAITFDDGPNGDYTLQILDILAQHSIKATFFFPGKNIERLPDIAIKARDLGHIIGNHTYSHPHLNSLSKEEIILEIERSEDIFNNVLGIKPIYFRPPYGEYNIVSEDIIKNKGYKLILWDMDCYSRDWQNPTPKSITDISTKNTRDGSIILLHDGRNIKADENRKNTVEALPDIITTLKNKGFDIVSLDKLCKE